MANNTREPSSAPQPERWYELKLGSSFKDCSSKFCTLRYEFKPASIDKNQAGMLHKTKDNRVTVEFNNNQPGKPKVIFEGTSEDYKDNDGVLFFDGESFRLERLHRAVKRLRHVRQPGESAAAVNIVPSITNASAVESRSPPLVKTMKSQALSKSTNSAMPQLEVERIDIGDAECSASKRAKRTEICPPLEAARIRSGPYEDVNILEDLDEGIKDNSVGLDMNLPNQNDSDDEIADVDASDDEDDGNKGPNAAEALRAQVNAAEEETSSSSDTGSGSSGSDTGSTADSATSGATASDDSDADSATSGGENDA